MGKILKLIKNENKKEMKKISTKIFITVSILFIILALVFVMLLKLLTNVVAEDEKAYWKQYVQDDIEMSKSNLTRAKEAGDEIEVKNLEAEIKLYQYALDNEIDLYSSSDNWKSNAIYELINREQELNMLKQIKAENEIKREETVIKSIYNAIETDDFNKYMEIKKDRNKRKI